MSWAHGIAARARPVLALVAAAVMGLVGAGGASAAGTVSVGCSRGVGDAIALVDAISAADVGGPSTIVLGAGCTYTLTQLDNGWYGANGLPPISATITIEGNGATITRQGRSFRFFYVGANPVSPGTFGYQTPGAGSLTLDDLTLANGADQGGSSTAGGGGGAGMGGAIFNQGTLVLDAVTLSGNEALGGDGGPGGAPAAGGGGMFASGTPSFGGFGAPALSPGGGAGGNAGGGGGGGGFIPTLFCLFPPCPTEAGHDGSGGSGGAGGGAATGTGGAGGFGGAGGDGSGGGGQGSAGTGGQGGQFGAAGDAGSSQAGGGGGGVTSGGGPAPAGGDGGGGGYGGGGGAAEDGAAGDGGFGGGGGSAGSVGAQGTGGFGGGAAGRGSQSLVPGGGGGGAGMGGALFNMQGSVTITNSTLAANSAIGGSGGAANGGQPAAGGQGLGGAIFNFNGQITVVSSTLAQNVASDDGGGIDNLGYDSSTLRAASVTLSNSIVFGSTDGAGNPVSDLFADQPTRVAVSGGGGSNQGVASTNASQADIVGRLGTGGIGSITGSPSSANPGLGVLAFNGGPGMATMALGPGSPALAAGAGCPATDERGVARPSGLCDLGAFQLSAPPPGSGPAPVSVALSGLRVTPAKFSVAGRRVGGRCVKATRANRGRPRCSLPIALRVTFTLNEPGTVVIRVTRKAPGRRVVGRCVTPTRKNRRHMRCTRFILLPGAVTLTAAAGANAFTFDGRIAGRALGPGTYELTAAPSGATQNGTSQTATFQLVR